MKRYKRKISDTGYSKNLTYEERILYKQAVKQIEETNRRLKKLEKGIDINKGRYNPKTRRFERTGNIAVLQDGQKTLLKSKKYVRYNTGSWASKKLLDNIGEYYNKKTRRISISKSVDTAELRKIIKATRNFLNSETSTVKGIKRVEDRTKDTISNIVSDELTPSEINTLYDFWNDKDWVDATQYIPPSDLYIILTESEDEVDFIEKIKMYIDEGSLKGDSDMRDKLVRIYNKFR